MVTEIIEVPNQAGANTNNAFTTGFIEDIVLTENTFQDAFDYEFRTSQFRRLAVQIANEGPITCEFELHATCIPSDGPAPLYDPVDYALLPNGSGRILSERNELFVNNNPYSWIILRLRKVGGGPSNPTIHVRLGGSF